MTSPIVLECRGISQSFAGIQALSDINLPIHQGQFHAIIGPNGAGKTTLFNILSGLQSPTAGGVFFAGLDITALPPWQRARLGIARSFQNLRLFGAMTLRENILVAAQQQQPYRLGDVFFKRAAVRAAEEALTESADLWLRLVGLYRQRDDQAMTLSYGAARRLELARALALQPRLLLLDEPAAGLNPAETDGLAEIMAHLRNDALTVVLVEHDMGLVMKLADRITVLNLGKELATDDPARIRVNPQVIDAYLGVSR
ncbi:MAG: ABC transporter ATP-binding protein [Candidatus Pacebacteria bacterium]|nr:ABC transporter ATP-binding protein [Candidatus Paceibacterota bacterium]